MLHSSDSLSERARGRWRGILSALGVDSRYLTGKHSPCPLCAGKDRWRFTDFNQGGCWICNQCGKGDGFELLKRLKDADFHSVAVMVESIVGSVDREKEREKPSETETRGAMRELWGRSVQITAGSHVAKFLSRRGINLAAFPPMLRMVDRPPMMCAKVISPDGRAVNVHRTFLTITGQKAAMEKPRMMMLGETPRGSAVRLGTIADGVLGIAEGIETALAASILFNIPVWATLFADSLSQFVPPAEVSRLLVFGDNDANHHGQWAAHGAARTAANRKIAVEVHIPPTSGEDWNDVLLKR